MVAWVCLSAMGQESYTTDSFRATQSNFNQMPFVKFDRVPLCRDPAGTYVEDPVMLSNGCGHSFGRVTRLKHLAAAST
jgi:hypothetical protein